jgi:tRNA threonylcarbamoyl adenosine modification protein YjeE
VIETDRTRCGSADATEGAGHTLAESLRAGDVVLLAGDLAAGKTTFVRGLVRGLSGDSETVSSPTFVLIQSYPCSSRSIRSLHHVDLYRLDNRVADLREVGLSEVLSDAEAVVAVEWPPGFPPTQGCGGSRSPLRKTTRGASKSAHPTADAGPVTA